MLLAQLCFFLIKTALWRYNSHAPGLNPIAFSYAHSICGLTTASSQEGDPVLVSTHPLASSRRPPTLAP